MIATETLILEYLKERAPRYSEGIIIGISEMDDCAVLECEPGYQICVTSDFIRGTDFDLYRHDFLNDYDLGYYLAAANFSDLAAMGAKPLGLLTNIRFAPDRPFTLVAQTIDGILRACDDFGAALIGGDSGPNSSNVLSATALGKARAGRLLALRNSQPGYAIFVSGEVGFAGAARAAGNSGSNATDSDAFNECLLRWKRPLPRTALGVELAALTMDIAATDTSDGILSSLLRVSTACEIGFEVDLDSLPIGCAVYEVGEIMERKCIEFGFGTSNDFELLICAPVDASIELQRIFGNFGIRITRIGTLLEQPRAEIYSAGCSVYSGVLDEQKIKGVLEID